MDENKTSPQSNTDDDVVDLDSEKIGDDASDVADTNPMGSNSDSNTAVDDEGFSRSDKVFDITSDLNITPINDYEVERDTDKPIENFAEKMAAETKGAKIYRESTQKQNSVAQNEPLVINKLPPTQPQYQSPIKPIDTTSNIPAEKPQDLSRFIRPASVPSNQPFKKPTIVPTKEQVNIQQPNQDNSKYSSELKPMRTYEGDVKDLLSKRKTSVTSMVIAETQRGRGTDGIGSDSLEETSNTWKKVTIAIVSLILIGGGVTVGYYLYMRSALAPTEPVIVQPKVQSIVTKDSQILIAIDKLSPTQIQTKIQNEVDATQAPNTIKEIVLTKTIGTVKSRVSSTEVLSMLDLSMPDVLKRSLTNSWMIGIYTDDTSQKDVFVIVTNNFFQNAFSGMLQWESVMADDIKQYLTPVKPIAGIANIPVTEDNTTKNLGNFPSLESILPKSYTLSTTTSTTTASTKTASTTAPFASTTIETEPVINKYFTIRGNFEDRIVRNKDVRAFRTTDGNILFLYSFIDMQRIIITTKESTLNEVLSRVEKESFVR